MANEPSQWRGSAVTAATMHRRTEVGKLAVQACNLGNGFVCCGECSRVGAAKEAWIKSADVMIHQEKEGFNNTHGLK